MANEDEKKITIVGGDGDTYAKGLVEPTTVTNARPCFACRRFELVRLERMLKHLTSTGGTILPDGQVQAPRPAEAKQGEGMKIDPRNMGWCRKDSIATDKLATCPEFQANRTHADFNRRR